MRNFNYRLPAVCVLVVVGLLPGAAQSVTLTQLIETLSIPVTKVGMEWPKEDFVKKFARFFKQGSFSGFSQRKDGSVITFRLDPLKAAQLEQNAQPSDGIKSPEDLKSRFAPLLTLVRQEGETWDCLDIAWPNTGIVTRSPQGARVIYGLSSLNGIPVQKEAVNLGAEFLMKSGVCRGVGIPYYTLSAGSSHVQKPEAILKAKEIRFKKTKDFPDELRGGVTNASLMYVEEIDKERSGRASTFEPRVLTLSWAVKLAQHGAVVYIDARNGSLVYKDEYK